MAPRTPAVTANDIMAKKDPKEDMAVFGSNPDFHAPDNKDDFIWSLTAEPHASRRKEILKKHPEIQKLFGHDSNLKYSAVALVLLQLLTGIYVRDWDYGFAYFAVAYIVGATATQAIFLAIHEISHNLAFKSIKANRYFGMLVNLPTIFPYSVTFKGYHIEHHKHQGVDGVDTDLPTRFEAVLFNNVLGKIFFASFQIFFYALRPGLIRSQALTHYHYVNMATQLLFNALVYYNFGLGPFVYWATSLWLAGSLHPCAAHFIAEHYVFVGEAETYSYYGPLNMLTYNVGYHNEHHDFPNIPGSRLPKLKEIAPEFYDHLPYHTSWPMVTWKFITDPSISAFNRVKRKPVSQKKD